MNDDWVGAALEVFREACEMPPHERVVFLDRACAGNSELRGHVEAMLVLDPEDLTATGDPDAPTPVRDMLEKIIEGATPSHSDLARIPETLCGYRILRLIAHGGMGTVYLAEQRTPVRREIALKVIKLGMDSKQVLTRFQLERQALAMMDHRAITKVFDAGTTEDGQLYFVMEFVRGAPLVEYCDEHRLSLKERIEIFQEICRGVQHAHQKGIVHRDLKPGNILVAKERDEHAVKIIDFGIARAMDRKLDGDSIHTEQGLLIGTPEYMSPEQANGLPVDTRTDVYSLGVVLYELLTGELPFTSQQLRKVGLLEIQRVLANDEPPKPSTRVSVAGDAAVEWATARRLTPTSLSRRLKGELDWIVLRAMAKEPERRYGSPEDLSRDLGRYLAQEPVDAGPPSASYRLSKFARKHRVAVSSAAAVLIVAVAGALVAWRYAIDAVEQKQRAQTQNARFNRVLSVVKIENAWKELKPLFPAWPENAPALRTWLEKYGRGLESELPEVQRALQELEGRKPLPTAARREADRLEHKQYEALQTQEKMVAALRRARDVSRGTLAEEVVELPESAPKDPIALYDNARPRVAPDSRDRKWGEEALGLALARRAFDVAGEDRFRFGDTLAWALHANGLDSDALAAGEAALAAAPPILNDYYAESLKTLKAKIADAPKTLADAEDRLAQLKTQVGRRAAATFEDEADQFLAGALQALEEDLLKFRRERGMRWVAQQRLAWAENIQSLTSRHPLARVTWAEAREALRQANGVTASKLYGAEYHEGHPIELDEQTGLVPIGMNPRTGLWEFYHLRSAFEPRTDGDPAAIEIPTHRGEDGFIEVTADTGIIFVLLPGATFTMGSQATDRTGENYDEQASKVEVVSEVTVAPCFVARHELTQGQWVRLSMDINPSTFVPFDRTPTPVWLRNPVDQVRWEEATEVLAEHRLRLPEESEWEYACRATTSTPWFPGSRESDLEGYVNLLDRTARGEAPWGGRPAPFNDGYVWHAPVGTYKPNLFGMYDMHGNVSEWCSKRWGLPRNGDRPIRGGGFMSSANEARSAALRSQNPTFKDFSVGLRAARTLLQRH